MKAPLYIGLILTGIMFCFVSPGLSPSACPVYLLRVVSVVARFVVLSVPDTSSVMTN